MKKLQASKPSFAVLKKSAEMTPRLFRRPRRVLGFTLVELMVTIAVMAIIAMMAAPSFSNMIARQDLNSDIRDLVETFSKARNQAVFLRKDITVHIVGSNDTHVNSDKDFYWKIKKANNTLSSPSGVTSLVFRSDGVIRSGIITDTTFTICNGRTKTTKVFILTQFGTTIMQPDGVC